jgi:hypothetical protein
MVAEPDIGKRPNSSYDGNTKKSGRNNMRITWTAKHTLVSTALWVTLIAHMGLVQASSNALFATQAVKRNKITKPKQDKGYGETIKERDRRLLRECRGRPNAGACEGYAS